MAHRQLLGAVAGVSGALLSTRRLLEQDSAGIPLSHVIVVGLFVSTWCAASSLMCAHQPHHTRPPRRQRSLQAALLLFRALICALIVAKLGLSAVLGSNPPELLLMAALQASCCVSAWGACALLPPDAWHGSVATRANGIVPLCVSVSLPDEEECTSRRRGSRTQALPRGWRIDPSNGFFEHKRSGRRQRDPPRATQRGSPLAALPPCNEEHVTSDLLEEGATDLSGSSSSGYASTPSSAGEADLERERCAGRPRSPWAYRRLCVGEDSEGMPNTDVEDNSGSTGASAHFIQ